MAHETPILSGPRRFGWLCAVSLLGLGCMGEVGGPGGDGNPGAGGGSGGTNPFGMTDPGELEDGVPFGTRVARLTHAQYDNTTSDLLYLTATKSAEFQADPVFNGYDNSVEDLRVTDRLGRDYRRAAEELAEQAVSDATAYSRFMPCTTTDAACKAQFIGEFGLRAQRRPLTSAEATIYAGLFDKGADLVASGDAFKDGVRVVIEAMLQSPKFLYRAELTQDQQADGFLKLDGYEIAQRLSYMAWNTMPDDALFDAAESGSLNEAAGLATAAARLLADERAKRPVADFHGQWLQLRDYLDLSRDPETFPDFSADLGPIMQQETQAFIEEVVFTQKKGFETLMTAPFSFVNDRLAALYGVSGSFGSQLVKTDLDVTQRKGLLTQIGFLAAHSYPNETSPIHRGVFIYRRILCQPVPDPVGIDTTMGAVQNPRTTREGVETQTGQTGCVHCHQLFNPFGFAFEQFDAVGKHRTLDRDNPVDTTGTATLDGQSVSFESSTDLIDAIATSDYARSCYTDNWLRYAFGRAIAKSDAKTIDQIATAMQSDDYTVANMLRDVTQSKAFRFRAPNND